MDYQVQLPVTLLIELTLRPLAGAGIYHYIRQRGDDKTGVILLKLNGLNGQSRLLLQQRDAEGVMGWMNATKAELVNEVEAEAYIKRSILRDPDLWVIEIEDPKMVNPFEGRLIE